LLALVLFAGSIVLIAEKLAPAGWFYVPPALDQRPWRRFFVKVADERRTAHLCHLSS